MQHTVKYFEFDFDKWHDAAVFNLDHFADSPMNGWTSSQDGLESGMCSMHSRLVIIGLLESRVKGRCSKPEREKKALVPFLQGGGTVSHQKLTLYSIFFKLADLYSKPLISQLLIG